MTKPERDRVELGVAAAAVALGLFVLSGSVSIPVGAGYDRIGPRFFPYVVGFGLFVSGAWLALGAWRRAGSRPPASARAVVVLASALSASVLLLERAGFILTATLLFVLAARAFDSRRFWRDALAGGSLASLVYVAATRGLGLYLPPGPF